MDLNTSDISKVVNEVESELLSLIIEHLKKNKLSADAARNLAKTFLSHLPVENFDEMVAILKEMSATSSEARDVYIKYYGIQEDLKTKNMLNVMAQHISTGNIEQAIATVKGGVNA